jgi:hypothetical protein
MAVAVAAVLASVDRGLRQQRIGVRYAVIPGQSVRGKCQHSQ